MAHINGFQQQPGINDRRPTANWDEKGQMLDENDQDVKESKLRRSDSMQENKGTRNYSFN